jgi:hypothetical protein
MHIYLANRPEKNEKNIVELLIAIEPESFSLFLCFSVVIIFIGELNA